LRTSQIGRLSARTGRATGLMVIVTLSVMLFTAVGARAEEKAPSNLDLMTTLGTSAVEQIITRIETDIRGKRVQLKPFGNGEEYQVLEDIFSKILTDKGITPVDPIPANPAGANDFVIPPFVLEYKIPVFRLSYVNVYRSYLIGGKKVRREASVRMSARLLTSTGDVTWFGDVSSDKTDQFSHGDLSRIQEGTYQFVKPEMPGSGWSKVVEPVFVSAIIVGMIYLFFSNQSDS
jgi:hypothetical protein